MMYAFDEYCSVYAQDPNYAMKFWWTMGLISKSP